MATEMEELIEFLSSPSPHVRNVELCVLDMESPREPFPHDADARKRIRTAARTSKSASNSFWKYRDSNLGLCRAVCDCFKVKKAAVDIVTGLTGSDDGLESLSKYAKTLLPSLATLLDQSKEVSEPAGQALVNLSQDLDMVAKMVGIKMVKTSMNLLYKPGSPITNLLVMLLVNLTQSDAGIADLLQAGDEKLSGLYVMKLVRSFCRSSSDSSEDSFEHVGSVLVNISKNEAGRKILMDPRLGLLKQIIRQFDSSSPLRKKGVSGTIRNCCFQAENQLQNLLLISEFLWPALLLPVAGNKVYSEQDTANMPLELGTALSIERESVSDPEIRVQALESIYLITLQEAGRRALWSVNGPRILQVGYEDEEDPKVMEAYERVGALLVHGNEEGEALAGAMK